MTNLVATYKCLEKHNKEKKLQVQVQQVQNTLFGRENSHKIKTMSSVEVAQETQVLDARSTVYEEETSHSILFV